MALQIYKKFLTTVISGVKTYKVDKETVCYDGFYLRIVTKKALSASAKFPCPIFLGQLQKCFVGALRKS